MGSRPETHGHAHDHGRRTAPSTRITGTRSSSSIGIFSALIVLTVITVQPVSAIVDLGPANSFVAIFVAHREGVARRDQASCTSADKPFNSVIFVMSFRVLWASSSSTRSNDLDTRGWISQRHSHLRRSGEVAPATSPRAAGMGHGAPGGPAPGRGAHGAGTSTAPAAGATASPQPAGGHAAPATDCASLPPRPSTPPPVTASRVSRGARGSPRHRERNDLRRRRALPPSTQVVIRGARHRALARRARMPRGIRRRWPSSACAPCARPAYRRGDDPREARVLLLLDHPNVAQLVDFGETPRALPVTEVGLGTHAPGHHPARRGPPAPALARRARRRRRADPPRLRRRPPPRRAPAHGVTAARRPARPSPSGVLLTVRGR